MKSIEFDIQKVGIEMHEAGEHWIFTYLHSSNSCFQQQYSLFVLLCPPPLPMAPTNKTNNNSNSLRTLLHAAVPSLQHAKAQFLAQHGHVYGYGGWLDANYWEEYGCRLQGQTYLDMTGA